MYKRQDEHHAYEKKIEDIQRILAKETEKFRIGQTAYHREQSRLESLKNITERYDGYGNSIRRVMDNKKQEPGLLGVVADIVKVEKEYEVAVETALGGSIQNIVTEDEDTAKRMIQFLKKNKFGRATFLPLTSIQSYGAFHKPEALKENGVIGIASTLVNVDAKYRDLAGYLPVSYTHLVINCGSSSLKFQLINSESEEVLAKGLCERIGIDGRLTYQPAGGDKAVSDKAMPTHTEAIQFVIDALTDSETGVVKSLDEIGAVGHRVVHGGEKFANSVVITEDVLKAIEECNDLAPLHNPANLIGINACQKLMPNTPMVAVFDTAFHQTCLLYTSTLDSACQMSPS